MPADPARIAIARDLLAQFGVILAATCATLRSQRRPCRRWPTTCRALSPLPDLARTAPTAATGSAWPKRGAPSRWTRSRPATSKPCSTRSTATARSRRNSRHGRHAGEHVIAAARAIYNRAIADGLIAAERQPSAPRRQAAPAAQHPPGPDRRRTRPRSTSPPAPPATTPSSTRCCCGCTPRPRAAAAARSALRLTDLDADHVPGPAPREGRDRPLAAGHPRPRRQPRRPRRAPRRRPAHRHAAALPQRRPLTSRRYDHLWHRIGQHLPWVAAQGISTHWLRHTTLTWVERHFGYGVARAYAGHTDTTGTGDHHLHQSRPPRGRHRSYRT